MRRRAGGPAAGPRERRPFVLEERDIDQTRSCCAPTWSGSRWSRSTAWRRSSCSSTRPSSSGGSILWRPDELHGRARRPSFAQPGADKPGEKLSLGVAARLSRYLQVLTQARKMGKDDDLLPGAGRLHARELDPDPARPVGVREVRQARGGLQRRVAGHADPQDPAHLRPAQHRPVRRRPPRHGDRHLGHLRRPRLPGRGGVRHRRRSKVGDADRPAQGAPQLRDAPRRRGRGHRRGGAGRPVRRPPRGWPTSSRRPG